MKEESDIYVVYRIYSKKERPDVSPNDRIVFYGWSSSKSVVKALISQRNKKKYKSKRLTYEMAESLYNDDLDPIRMIDFIVLKSASTGEEIKLFVTSYELRNLEIQIQSYFVDLSRLVERDNGQTRLLELFVNIDEYYADALAFLGFRPPELNALFDSVEDYRESTDSIYDIECLIDNAYEAVNDVPYDVYYHQAIIPGQLMIDDISKKIIYSIESFIKFLKEEM